MSGLPPLLIHVGGNEVLLDDFTRLATHATADRVRDTLEVFPGAPHVFPAFVAMLEEGADALDTAGKPIRELLGVADHI